jgi:hypothetical protein
MRERFLHWTTVFYQKTDFPSSIQRLEPRTLFFFLSSRPEVGSVISMNTRRPTYDTPRPVPSPSPASLWGVGHG